MPKPFCPTIPEDSDVIIILNGVPNAGKSTMARLLVEKLPNTAHLEIDLLREMVHWMPLEEAIGIAFDSAIALLPGFIRRGMNVVIDYPLDLFWWDYIRKPAEEFGVPVYSFSLRPRLDVAIQNRGTRDISPELRERIIYLYNTDMNDSSIGTFIDNSDLSPEETAERVLRIIEESG